MHRSHVVAFLVRAASAAAQPVPSSDAADPKLASVARARELARQVTISRDKFGVPHSHGTTDAAAVFGAIYARAEDEMARIENAHALAIGRASLVLGPAALTWDRLVLSYEVPDLSRRQYDQAPEDVRTIVQAAADALNLYLALHPAYTPVGIECWEPWMLCAREYAFALYQAQQEVQRLYTASLTHGADAPPEPPKPAEPPKAPDGSNAWAIAGSRTASGHAMLYCNPHIPLDEPYEVDVRSDQGLHVSGSVMYGAGILPVIGFNDRLGWSLTVNYPDIADAYAVDFNIPGDPLAYRHGDQILHATRWSAKVPVKTEHGVEEQELVFAKTHQGPILFEAGGKSIVVRVAGIENLRAVEQWYRMAKAHNLDEWKGAVSLFALVFHNLVYADADGNIGYIYNAAFPTRNPAFDWSGTLDGSDPRTDWLGYHALADLPQVWNPPCGYVLSCNSPPFVATAEGQNPDRSKFPADMIGKDLTDGRVPMSRDLLSRAQKWTLDDLERAAFDTRVYSMDASRAPLLAEFQRLQDATPDKVARIAPAIDLLRGWDGRLALDSPASSLFMVWVEKLFSPEWAKRRAPGDLCAAFAEVMDEFERDHGDWRVPWGDLNRHQRFDSTAGLAVGEDRESLPCVGGHGSLGVSFCYLARASGTKRRYGYHGSAYVAAVEFGESPVARTIVPFGASRDPASPHYADQAPIFASGRFKVATFTAHDTEAAALRTYHPGE